jgi:perosamine synthetase
MKRIPVAGPWITQREIDYVTDAVTNAWYENANMYNARFEQTFARTLGVKHAVSLPSCTSAIHLSLLALGVGPGDEVVVPDLTWIATVAPVLYVGATPVFADVDVETWCLSADALDRVATPRTKAIIPVDLYGGMPDMDAIGAVAKRRGFAVVEDAAEAIGSRFKDRMAGSFGDTGVFSFHGSKTLTTGEGGMLVSDRDDLVQRALTLRDHGRPPGDKMFFNNEVAYKYKMSSLQAALGLAQIERIEELVARKREIFGFYRKALSGVDGIRLNAEPEGVLNTYWMVTVIVDPKRGLEKRELMARMSDRGVDCRPIFSPLSSLPAFEGHAEAIKAQARNAVSYGVGRYGINLPSGFHVDEATAQRVAEALKAALAGTAS